MKNKYKYGMIFIILLITGFIFIGAGYTSFRENEEQTRAMIKVKSGLSINYLNGNHIKTEEDTYEVHFSITNSDKDNLYYYIKLNNIQVLEDASYKLIMDNDVIEENISKVNVKNRIKIIPGETHSYTLIFYNPKKGILDTELEIDLETVDHSLKSTILQANEVKEEPETSFDTIATTNEGLILGHSEEGDVYYFRGDVKNNYVYFADLYWRVVKLNADGTSLLVLNDLLDDTEVFFEEKGTSTNFLESNVYRYLESYYETNLKQYDAYIANSKYCTDDNASKEENGTIYFLPETRIFNNFSPVVNCPGTNYTAKIGLLNADEVMMAGASLIDNPNFYLVDPNVDDAWWTMTLNKKENNEYHYIGVSPTGIITKDNLETSYYSIRPAITLIKKLNTTGSGTIDDPYVVSPL